jgi:hypothetical protein
LEVTRCIRSQKGRRIAPPLLLQLLIKKVKRSVLLSLIPSTLFLFGADAFAQSSVTAIDAYSTQVTKYSRSHKSTAIMAVDVSDYEKGSPANWRVFKTQADYEAYAKEHDIYTEATNWRQGGRVVLSEFGYSSPSGDWSRAVKNYFRSDGTLAKAESEMRTFVNNCVIRKRLYYGADGALIQKTTNYSDLFTNRPKKPCEAMGSGDVTYFTSVEKLPFAKLLR